MLDALEAGDTLVIKTLHQFGRSTQTHAFAEEFRGLGVGLRVLNPGGDGGSIASSRGRILPGCASHIFRRAMRIPGRNTLQRRSFGAVRKLPGRHDSQPRPQIFRFGLLKQGKHCLCARHCVSTTTRSSSILSSKSLFLIGMRLLWPMTTRKPDGQRGRRGATPRYG